MIRVRNGPTPDALVGSSVRQVPDPPNQLIDQLRAHRARHRFEPARLHRPGIIVAAADDRHPVLEPLELDIGAAAGPVVVGDGRNEPRIFAAKRDQVAFAVEREDMVLDPFQACVWARAARSCRKR